MRGLASTTLGAILAACLASACATDGAILEEARNGRDAETLLKLLENEAPWIAHDAARALGDMGHAPAAEPLLRLVVSDTADPYARGMAAVALGKLGVAAAAPVMERQLERAGHAEERYCLVHALSMLCTSDAVAILEDRISDNDVLVSRAARKGLLECAARAPGVGGAK